MTDVDNTLEVESLQRDLHTLKGGYGFQHVVNDINSYYPGGYVQVNWGGSFVFGGVNRGTGTYGYYEVNDRRITNKAGADINWRYIENQPAVMAALVSGEVDVASKLTYPNILPIFAAVVAWLARRTGAWRAERAAAYGVLIFGVLVLYGRVSNRIAGKKVV